MNATTTANINAANTHSAPGWTPLRLALMAALTLAAVWLGWQAWRVNITQSCWLGQWPYLPVCEEINGRTPAEQAQRLQVRLAENPGDSQALVALMALAHQPGVAPQLNAAELLAQAVKAAPQNPSVLRLQASALLQAGQWREALDPLMRLAEHHRDADATRVLAEMVGLGVQQAPIRQALVAAAQADAGWVERVLRGLRPAKVPMEAGWPLVEVLMASRSVPPKLGLEVISALKAEKSWVAAQALWMHLWNRPLPLVFNGDFEQALVKGGLDWEVPGPNDHRAGAQVSLVGRKGHGQVMRVTLGGKGFSNPLVRQHLLLPAGQYRLSGQWQSTDVRSEQGLAWVLRCEADQRELARLPGMKTTGLEWQSAQVSFTVPADCGLGMALALETQAPYEARTGLRGEMVLDGLKIDVAGAP